MPPRSQLTEGIKRHYRAVIWLGLGLLAMALFGFYGIGRGGGQYAHDMRYLFVAGEIWEAAHSPYNFDAFHASMKARVGIDAVSYAYPPNSAALAMALSAGSLDTAKILISILNLASLAMLCVFVAKAAGCEAIGPEQRYSCQSPEQRQRCQSYVIFTAAVVIGNPFTAHVIWMGQTTLISAACLYAAWLLAERRMDVVAGALLGLAAFKPQLVLLVGLWFVLDRRWLLVLAAAAVTGLMSLWPVLATGWHGSWGLWLTALADYQGGAYNVLTFRHVFGLRSLLASAGIMLPPLLPLAIAAVIGLYCLRAHYQRIWLITPLLMLSVLLVYAHDYDLAPLGSMAFVLLAAARGRVWLVAGIALLACTLYFPQRIWERIGLEDLARSREIALFMLLLLYLVMARDRRATYRGTAR